MLLSLGPLGLVHQFWHLAHRPLGKLQNPCIGVFQFHCDDGGGSLCRIFDQGKPTPFCFTEDIMPENFITKLRIEDRKAKVLVPEG